jgi:hypothetical protein
MPQGPLRQECVSKDEGALRAHAAEMKWLY